MSGQSIQSQHTQNVAVHAPPSPFLLHVLLAFFPSSSSGHNFGRSPEPVCPAPASRPSTALSCRGLVVVAVVATRRPPRSEPQRPLHNSVQAPTLDAHLPFVEFSICHGTAAGTGAGFFHLQNTRS
jgi:hypothetical protein